MLRRTVLEEPAEGPCRVCTMVLSMLSQRGYSGDVSAGDYRSDAVAGFDAGSLIEQMLSIVLILASPDSSCKQAYRWQWRS
jgi:hypothetical protein